MTKKGWAEWQESFKKGESIREITRYPERNAKGEIPCKGYYPSILPHPQGGYSQKDILAGLSFHGSYVNITIISHYDNRNHYLSSLDLGLVKWSFRIHRKDIKHVVVGRTCQMNGIYTFF